MEIRERRDDDLDQLFTVAARVKAIDKYPVFLPDGNLARFLTRPTPVAAWVAVRADEVVGHVALNPETSILVMRLVADLMSERGAIYVSRFLVDPAVRRQGVGRRLLEKARRSALDHGHVPMLDVVDTPTAKAAISLYRREGWKEVGRVSFELKDTEIDELVFLGPES